MKGLNLQVLREQYKIVDYCILMNKNVELDFVLMKASTCFDNPIYAFKDRKGRAIP